MSFRISVESIICRGINLNREVLLVKRAPNCKVAPGAWNVPAGKVNILETTFNAVVRETFEETKLDVSVVKLLAENAFEVQVGNEPAYRNMFTYLTKIVDEAQTVEINHKHTEFIWATKEAVESDQFSSLMPRLKEIILKILDDNGN